jgi:hypothetical protein
LSLSFDDLAAATHSQLDHCFFYSYTECGL